MGYIPHFGTPPSVIIVNDGVGLSNYSIEAPVTSYHRNGSIPENARVVEIFPVNLTGISYSFPNKLNDEHKEGVYIKVNSTQVNVIGQSKGAYNTDTFFALPIEDLHLDEYVYYGVSVASNTLADGSVVVVGSEDDTILNITVPVSANIKVNNTEQWCTLNPNVQNSYKINRLQIVYVATSIRDLTGTRVVSNKPVSVFSGHECAWVPDEVLSCDHLMEQMLPIDLWGTVHYVAPLASRSDYTIKILAAHDYTIVEMRCNNDQTNYTIDTGECVSRQLNNREFCAIHSDNVVLVAQFSHGYGQGDSMMTLIPATTHYTNTITSSTIHDPIETSYRHYINIIVMADYYQPNMIFLTAGGVNQSLESQSWVPIRRGNSTEAYAAQVRLNIAEGVFEIRHTIQTALMTAVVYGFLNSARGQEGYGHPGWLMRYPGEYHICCRQF